MRPEFRILKAEFRIENLASRHRFARLAFLLLTPFFFLLAPAFAATHVTATYDLGANPRVMATVNGTPQYGLAFAQRNKQITYGGVEYGPSVVKAYLDASGQLNDGAGNLWLDLIPNLGATPGDSYYVVTLNIQGRVHAEIWVVPDVASVAAELCRQAQPPSSTAPALFYQFLQQAGDDLPQRQKLNFTGEGVSCVDNAGQLRTDCTLSGGGGSVPKASATTSGTVKTDTTTSDPVVYLTSSADSLLAAKAPLAHTHPESEVTNLVSDLAGKVPNTRAANTTSPLSGGGALSSDLTLSLPAASGSQDGYLTSSNWTTFNNKENALTFNSPLARSVSTISCPTCSVSGHSHAESDVTSLVTDLAAKVPTTRNVNTSSPLSGGGVLSSDLTLSCPTCEVSGNKDAASGYAGLTSGAKLNAAQGQEIWGAADLTDYSGTSGSGSTAIKATFTSLASNDILKWSGSNWVNATSAAKADALASDPTDCGSNQYATAIAANGNLTCSQPATSNLSDGANVVKNNQANTYSGGGLQDLSAQKLALPAATTLPASCTANKEIYVDTDATPAGQQVYLCNAAGNGWNLIGDGGGAGGGDNISVNGTAATDADFDDSTPAAPANGFNVKWQKDALTPNNLSAHLLTTTVGSTTWGSGSAITWTFDDNAGADPTIAFNGSGALGLNAGGTNQNVTLTPSGTGTVVAPGAAGDNRIAFYSGPASSSFTAGVGQVYIAASTAYAGALNPNAARTSAFLGVHENNAGSNSMQGLYGLSDARHTSGARGDVAGVEGDAYLSAAGTVTNLAGVAGYAVTNAGTVTNMAALLAYTNTKGGGTVNNNYGVYVQDQAGIGTANYAIYTVGTAPAKFGGVVNSVGGFQVNGDSLKNFASLSWFFPGTVVAGVQTARALVPEGVTGCTLSNSRISANTTASGSSTYNIQRCTGGAGNCSSTANIYSSDVTLNASTESVAGGTPNTTTVTAGDAFRVNLVSVGSGLADVTVTMTYKCENTN